MERIESKTMKVKPAQAQMVIEKMQRFHWNLANSQEMNTVNNYLERDKKGELYQVRGGENYVNLTFSRSLNSPYINTLKRLEDEFNSIIMPKKPKKVTVPIILGAAFVLLLLAAPIASFLLGAIIYSPFVWIKYKYRYPKQLRKYNEYLRKIQELEAELAECS